MVRNGFCGNRVPAAGENAKGVSVYEMDESDRWCSDFVVE
jgi:hypothetical protein